jgi:hypothetical protein
MERQKGIKLENAEEAHNQGIQRIAQKSGLPLMPSVRLLVK